MYDFQFHRKLLSYVQGSDKPLFSVLGTRSSIVVFSSMILKNKTPHKKTVIKTCQEENV